HAQKIAQTRPNDGVTRSQGTSVDDGGYSVGRIMKAVDEFKTKGNDQSGRKENEGSPRNVAVVERKRHGKLCSRWTRLRRRSVARRVGASADVNQKTILLIAHRNSPQGGLRKRIAKISRL